MQLIARRQNFQLMKTYFGRAIIHGVSLAGWLVAVGCGTQNTVSSPAAKNESSEPKPAAPAIEAKAPPTLAEKLEARFKGVDMATLNLSPGVEDIIRLARSGVSEPVVLAYIAGSTNAYSPPLDELVYLNEVGLPGAVVAAMVERGNHLREEAAKNAANAAAQAAALAAKSPPAPAPVPAPVAPAPVPVAVPAPVAVQSAPPVVVASPPPTTVVVQQPAPPEVPTQVVQFFEPLSPHGTWMRIDDYGWCWQPSVVSRVPLWRPYADSGRWIYTDCGWYWQSDYSWGWAPFHYGRWLNHSRRGWVWIPDTTWSAAWVSWRVSPTHCGWAPLPPTARFEWGFGLTYRNSREALGYDFDLHWSSFTFVPVNHFCDPNPHRYYASGSSARQIHGQTTVINNYTTVNNVVINGGIETSRVTRAGGAPVRQYAVRSEATTGSVAKSERLVREGSEHVLYRPQLSAPEKPGTHRQNLTTAPTSTTVNQPLTAPSPVTSTPQTPAASAPVNSRAKPFKPAQPVVSTPQVATAPAPVTSVPQPVGVPAGQNYPDRRKPHSPVAPSVSQPAPVQAQTPPPARPVTVQRPEPAAPAKPVREYNRAQPEVKTPPASAPAPQPARPQPSANPAPSKYSPQSAPANNPARPDQNSERSFREARR